MLKFLSVVMVVTILFSSWMIFNDTHLVGQAVAKSFCMDKDNDGYCKEGGLGVLPTGKSGWKDCDDMEPASYPGAVELCDGIDNNCDGLLDYGSDPDGGKGYLQRSSVYDAQGRLFTDACVTDGHGTTTTDSSGYLREAVCLHAVVYEEVKLCDYGCQNGACTAARSCTPAFVNKYKCTNDKTQSRQYRESDCSFTWQNTPCPYGCNRQSGHCCMVSAPHRCSDDGKDKLFSSSDCGEITERCPSGTKCAVQRGEARCVQ